jgi:hypothetical protein
MKGVGERIKDEVKLKDYLAVRADYLLVVSAVAVVDMRLNTIISEPVQVTHKLARVIRAILVSIQLCVEGYF